MKNKNILFIVLSLILLLTLSACGSDVFAELNNTTPAAQNAEPTTIDPVAIFTSAAETVAAQMTQTAIAFSPTPAPPTATQVIPPTATLIQLNAASPTAIAGAGTVPTITPIATTVTIANTPEGPICDSMRYGDPLDVNYPDDSEVPAGTNFEKIWRIYNDGVCTWDEGYMLVPIASNSTRPNDLNPLDAANPAWEFNKSNRITAPGEVADISAHLTAPLDNGTYETCFILQNDRGVYFGGVVCVRIKVVDGK